MMKTLLTLMCTADPPPAPIVVALVMLGKPLHCILDPFGPCSWRRHGVGLTINNLVRPSEQAVFGPLLAVTGLPLQATEVAELGAARTAVCCQS